MVSRRNASSAGAAADTVTSCSSGTDAEAVLTSDCTSRTWRSFGETQLSASGECHCAGTTWSPKRQRRPSV